MRGLGAAGRATFRAAYLALLAVGCQAEEVTYTTDVAPIIASSCLGCHAEGGVGPFSLETYESAREHAAEIADAVEDGRMPPWPPEHRNGPCPPLEADRDLPPDQVSLLTDWARGGTLRGDPKSGPSIEPAALRWLDAPTVNLEPEPFDPDPMLDDYRCFVLDPGLTTDQFITAYGVGRADGIHHLHLWALDEDADAEAATQLDEEAPGGGFPCLDGEGVAGRHLTVWGPSDPVRRHPAGTGLLLRARKKVLLQIHFHHANSDAPFIALELAPSVDRAAEIVTIGAPEFLLPPRQAATSVSGAAEMAEAGLLWGVRAHMHGLGSKAHISLKSKGDPRCLLEIPRWDAKWQLMYFFEQPIPIAAGDEVSIDCTYDTTSRTVETASGMTGDDEMCNANFFLTSR